MRRRGSNAVLGVVLALALAASACGGGAGDTAVPSSAATAPPATTATPSSTVAPTDTATPTGTPAVSPQQLANLIADDYAAMRLELRPLLERELPAVELEPQIGALKEKYIEKMVAHGHVRQALSPGDRSTVDLALWNRFAAEPTAINDLMNQIVARLNAEGDHELAREIASLNIITQYADFELLKKQEPEEAERLGIE